MRGLAWTGLVIGVAVTTGAGFAPAPAADHVLVSFGGRNGAGSLSGVSVSPGGTLYGTTVFGGTKEIGTVFRLTPDGSGGYTEKVLYSFTNAAGNRPDGNIVRNGSGDLFGVTLIGGADGQGVVYELTPSGPGYTEKVLHSFTGGLDGGQPLGPLVLDSHGDLFGVTQFGGTGGQGVIFEFTPSGTGYTERVLHDFAANASLPQAGLTRASDGTLYGTTYGASPVDGNGTVFSLALTTSGPVYRTLYAFKGGTDGANPFGMLTVDGTTTLAGIKCHHTGCGTIFELVPAGPGGLLYGTTRSGGTATGCSDGGPGGALGCGTVYTIKP